MPFVSVVNYLFEQENPMPKEAQDNKETNKKDDKDTEENER